MRPEPLAWRCIEKVASRKRSPISTGTGAARRDLEILSKRGACYLRLDEPEKALADFDRVNRYSLGLGSLRSRGDLRHAQHVAAGSLAGNRSIGTSATIADSWGNRGIALLMLGQDQEALASFQTSVNLWQPMPVRTDGRGLGRPRYQGLGQAYHRLGQDELAVRAYTEAIAINTRSDPNGFAGRGDVLRRSRCRIRRSPTIPRRSGWTRRIRGHIAAEAFTLRTWVATSRHWPTWTGRSSSIRNSPKRTATEVRIHARHGRNEQALEDYDTLIGLLPQQCGGVQGPGRNAGADGAV